jgi:hypothetical protein
MVVEAITVEERGTVMGEMRKVTGGCPTVHRVQPR